MSRIQADKVTVEWADTEQLVEFVDLDSEVKIYVEREGELNTEYLGITMKRGDFLQLLHTLRKQYEI